ncbi:MAG: hypothetical protein ACQEQE_05230 [Bacillota bacterium]
MRKLIAVILFVALVAGYYFVIYNPDDTKVVLNFKDDFNELNREFWYFGRWRSQKSSINSLEVDESVLNLKVDKVDEGPYLLSRPIKIEKDYKISFKRRVKISYANDKFTGGLVLYQTDSKSMQPMANKKWEDSFGQAAVLVEYVHNYNEDSIRPGRHIFRVLPPTWEVMNSARLIKPIFNEWFIEELIYDTRMNRIIYKINGVEYNTSGLELDKDYIRFFTHSYGWGTGHEMKIDWIKIKITDEDIIKRGKNE